MRRRGDLVRRRANWPICLTLAVLTSAPAAAAETDFYSGKTIQVLIGFSAGGGYDIYARTLARHMGRHIPGNPRLIPQNMPGAGSLKASTISTMSPPRTALPLPVSRRAW